MKTATQNRPAPAEADKKIRVFVVDDHPITRRGIIALVTEDVNLVVCGEAESAPQALELIPKLNPDLAIIDISLASMNGIELMKNLKALLPKLPVLIMSMHDENLYAERALRAGARGYIMKQEASQRIVTAIHRVLSGELYLSDQMQEKMLKRIVDGRNEENVFSIDKLSDREMEVFQLIGNGFSTRQIAAQLNLSVKTIESYREHLKLKLMLEKGSDMTRYAIQWVQSQSVPPVGVPGKPAAGAEAPRHTGELSLRRSGD
ncbi:MAG TPA: response regulator transcription factor [Opitutaceae bacterium]|nr:response regulator transcription factor [Opitutaceae bacterium]